MSSASITRRDVFNVWLSSLKENRIDCIVDFISSNFCSNSATTIQFDKLKVLASNLCTKFETKWQQANRTKPRFFHNNNDWLTGAIDYSYFTSTSVAQGNTRGRGRPNKNFEDCSQRSKERKSKNLANVASNEQLFMAVEMQIRTAGKRNSARIVKELAIASPERGSQIKKIKLQEKTPKSLSPDEALAMILDLDLSTNKYRLMKQYTKHINRNLYPSYELVRASKTLCYPENIKVTESYAEINLQSLMDHTILRLCASYNDVLTDKIGPCHEVSLLCKWGCDGANQNLYKPL